MSSLGGAVEAFLQALAAELFLGCIYGLMCIGLGLIFGIMRIINFAQGDLLMLGMFASLLPGHRRRRAGVSRARISARSSARCWPARSLFVGGALLHKFLISRVSGLRTAGIAGRRAISAS